MRERHACRAGKAGHSYRFWSDARRDLRLRLAAMELLERVGLTPRGEVAVKELAHGEQKQLELAIALATATADVAARRADGWAGPG